MDLALAILCGLLTLFGWVGQATDLLPAPAAYTLFALAFVAGSYDLVIRSAEAIRAREFRPDIDLLMLVAALGAASIGHPAEGAFLLFLFSLANALEHRAMERAKRAISALAELAPATAIVLADGREITRRVEDVAIGDIVLVKPAERVPVDGEVSSGSSAVDQAPITGESTPIEKTPGDAVFAGTVNGEGVLQVRTTRAAGDRTLDRVVKLVEEAQHAKAPVQRATERFERIFVPAVLVLCLGMIFVPPLMGWLAWKESFYRAMVLLTGASPCALALGTPAAVLCGIAQAARQGILVKGGQHLETLALVDSVALDKTGTLTAARPVVTDVLALDGHDEDEVLAVAAAVEQQSQHPLAHAIVQHASDRGLRRRVASDVTAVTSKGIRGSVEGRAVEIGTARMWDGQPLPARLEREIERLRAAGRSVVAMKIGDAFAGVIGVADVPRGNAAVAVASLKAIGIRPVVVLTGDNAGVANAVAREVGADEVHADLLPEDKVRIVREMGSRGMNVAMIGDGVNDAPALAAARIGIAMGGAGTAAALETADMALMGDDLGKLSYAIELARRTRQTIRQNIAIAVAVIALLIVTSVLGWVTIGPAVVMHEGSTLVVIANALRLLRFTGSGGGAAATSAAAAPRDRLLPSDGVPAQAAVR
jgi:Cd2+/Zn2+-exporting ATPase